MRGMQCIEKMAVPASMLSLCILAGACSVTGGEPVQGWPKLQVFEHYVPHHVMRERCAKYVGFGMTPEACAEFNLATRRCDLWFSADFPPQPFIVQHEREHCLGYEHAGENDLRNMLARYRASLGEESASTGASGKNRDRPHFP